MCPRMRASVACAEYSTLVTQARHICLVALPRAQCAVGTGLALKNSFRIRCWGHAYSTTPQWRIVSCITSRFSGRGPGLSRASVGTSGVTPVPRGASWALVSIYLGTLCIADKTVRRNQKSQMPTGDRAPPREGARELAHEYSKLLSVGMGIW